MIKLGVNDYTKVIEPLEKLTINTLFARSVLDQQITGSVYVNSKKDPKVFYIAHPYGMSLLFGDTENEKFNKNLFLYLTNRDRFRSKDEWLQVFPSSWKEKLEIILGSYLIKRDLQNTRELSETDYIGRLIENTRVNFVFDNNKYKVIEKQLDTQEHVIVRTTKEMFRNVDGNVIPKYFWNDENQFYDKGIGFSLIWDGEVASTAFSSFRIDNLLEIGIETQEKYRGKGFALYICSALINYCLKNDLEPIWACRLENIASYELAQKLGFVPSLFVPYYRLPV